jgi:hypothetical protein
MIKEIRYNGYTATPSDYECPDGDLETAIGVVAEDGGLQVVLPPKLMFTLPEGRKVWFIHTTSAFTHYIVTDENDGYIYWYDTKGNSHVVYNEAQLNPTGFNAIGNTLIVFSQDAINYIFWKDGEYKLLGSKVPDIDIQFGLIGHPRLFSLSDEDKKTFSVEMKNGDSAQIGSEWSDETKTAVTDVVMAKLNKFIAAEATNSGRFCFPFFVRYALRMFDGSLICHSAPILMMPGAPIVTTNGNGGRTLGNVCDVMLVASDISFKFIGSELTQLKNWSDIISGIEIYVSKPIYTYDQSGKCDMFAYDTYSQYHSSFVGSLYSKTVTKEPNEDCFTSANGFTGNTYNEIYAEWDYWSIMNMYFNLDSLSQTIRVHLPEYTEEKMKEQYLSTSTFYFLKSINIEDLENNGTIDIADDYLQSLVARTVMTDDYLSHDRLAASTSFVYNKRLSLSGITRYLYKGYSPASLWCRRNATACLSRDYVGENGDTGLTTEMHVRYEGFDDDPDNDVDTINPNNLRDIGTTTIDVYLNDNSTPAHVSNSYYSLARKENLARFFYRKKQVGPSNSVLVSKDAPNFFGAFLYYPNVNATRMVITNSELGSYEVKLQAHDYLNGAVGYIYATTQRQPSIFPEETITYQNYVDVPNKVYTSEVNNTFYFTASNINTIGTGSIMGLCTAAKALSQGQFGAFPLYAFSTDGVWALTVNETTGGFSAKQPITMDVCISPESITQIDSSVLFATDRGIMLLSGSNTTCISDVLNLSQSTKLVNTTDEKILNFTGIDDIEVVSFITYLRGCRMVYDYVHQHIIVYNTEYKYAYIYSFKSKKWGLINSNIASSVNSYPNALVMDSDNNLVDYSASDTLSDDETADFTLITRPIKLDSDALKTVDTIIQRGYFQKGNIQTVLLGSRDLYNWFTLMSSQDHYLRGKFGTPYKYFKIIVKGKLESNETVVGCTVQYTPRLTNRPR